MVSETGPFLQVAAFCERVLEERDGTQSLIRIVDRVTTDADAVDAGTTLPVQQLYAVVMLKGGEARGSLQLKIAPVAPSGLKLPEVEASVLFEGGEDRGVTAVVPLALPLKVSGVYWFSILLDDVLITKMPLRVVHQRLRRGTPAAPPSPESPPT